MSESSWHIETSPHAETLLRHAGFSGEQVFADSRIRIWRDLPERQNGYLELPASPDGSAATPARLHIKRFKAPHGPEVRREVAAIELLAAAGIPTVPLLTWGLHPDGRAFLVTADLTGYTAADRVVTTPEAFARFAPPIAELAAKLHQAGLHHQDLYLCHFFVNPEDPTQAVHLIDPGRVSRLPAFPMNIRWIVKDLAQLSYSTLQLGRSRAELDGLLADYFQADPPGPHSLVRALIPLKVAAIGRHDRRLRERHPTRNVSID